MELIICTMLLILYASV